MIFFKNSPFYVFLQWIVSGLFTLTLVLMTACSGDKNSTEPTDNPFPDDSLSFSQHIQPIFFSNCTLSGCHDPASQAGGLDLLSEPPSFFGRSRVLVVIPFSPTGSLLYRVLFTSDPSFNVSRMPRYFSLDKIAILLIELFKTSRSTSNILLPSTGITRW